MNWALPDVQAGFRKGRWARDQITNIHWITEKAREFQKNIYFCFTNYAKAFDGQGGLACCSPWRHKESEMTERLNWTDELFVYFEDQSLAGRVICKYFLSFCQLSFHFVYGSLCCAKAFNLGPFVYICFHFHYSRRWVAKDLAAVVWISPCGSQQTVENSSRDGNTRPPDLPPEKSVCRSRSNS